MNDKVLAYTMLRLFMGLLMFMHGAIRLGPKYEKFITWAQISTSRPGYPPGW